MPTKPWTVMFYLVAEPISDGPGQATGEELNAAADAEVEMIGKAVARHSNAVQAVCQVDHNGTGGITRVAFDESGRHELDVPERDQASTPSDRSTIRRFLAAASTAYPSERQAVFFWGHSFGPGGMFQTNPSGPMLSPTSLSARQRKSMLSRHPAARPLAHSSSNVLNLPDLASVLTAATGAAPKHLDLVVFKDCCMNTLEVAYELARIVDFQLGSQGKIPVDLTAPRADGTRIPSVWPYEPLFAAIADAIGEDEPVHTAALSMLDVLGDFYSTPNNLGENNDDVPMSLLDLRNMDDVTETLNAFVTAIKTKIPSADKRSASILNAVAGDPALVDVLAMCDQVGISESKALAQALGPGRMVVDRRAQTTAFNGVSLVYTPPGLAQGLIMTSLFPDEYDLLRISRVTLWRKDVAYEASLQPAVSV